MFSRLNFIWSVVYDRILVYKKFSFLLTIIYASFTDVDGKSASATWSIYIKFKRENKDQFNKRTITYKKGRNPLDRCGSREPHRRSQSRYSVRLCSWTSRGSEHLAPSLWRLSATSLRIQPTFAPEQIQEWRLHFRFQLKTFYNFNTFSYKCFVRGCNWKGLSFD